MSFFVGNEAHSRNNPVPDLIRYSLDYHPLVRSQQGVLDAANSGVDAARWQFWPSPSVAIESAGSSTGDDNYSGDGAVTTIGIRQPLWTGGRLSSNLGRSEARVAIAEAELDESRQQLALRVIQAWSEAFVAEQKVRAFETSRDVHLRLLNLVRRRYEVGASAKADVSLANVRLNTLQAELETAIAQRNTALNRLGLLTGRSIDRAIVPEVGDLVPPPLNNPELSATLDSAVVSSPQIAKARAQSDVAKAEIGVARASMSPEVYLQFERQLGSFQELNQPSQGRVFLALSYALDGGLSNLSSFDAAASQYQATLEGIEAQKLSLEDQIRTDYTLAQAAKARREGLEVAQRAAAEVLDSYERQFLAGRKQWQELMNAARDQSQGDILLADALGAQQLYGWRLAVLSLGVESVIAKSSPASGAMTIRGRQ